MMDINNLDRPICFIDIETTGLDFKKDEIIQIIIKKINPDKSEVSFIKRFNPIIEIQKEAFEKHGISKEDLVNEGQFKDSCKEILDFLEDSHLFGFNIIYFDLPFLIQKLYDNGHILNFKKKGKKIVDIKKLFNYIYNPNSIEFIWRFLKQDLITDISNLNDVELSLDILNDVIDKNPILNINTIEAIESVTNQDNSFDLSGKILFKDNELFFNFGKYKDKKVVDVINTDNNYIQWVLNSDIPIDTKMVLKTVINYYKKK